ncbi:hypothetical protein [Blastococcus mobilis]|uniref:Uncharacterized protein n=1 Tax=Blastococcus mobilis TaxID=1938746 RepID=A0A238UPS7_9ACTN|nr:hypothetical protein [Blastococcus mobilis]SNR23523.1 hypothetical protein SAMN06272737_101115 [Blastococcus mobilis]
MIQAWRDSPDAAVADVKLVGHRWSAPSFRARDLLARNAVPYRWYSRTSRRDSACSRPPTPVRTTSP